MTRRIVVGTFVTADGVMQAPGGPDEDRDGGFEHGGWSFPFWDDMMNRLIVEWTDSADALLLGRKTYEIFAAHWPRITGDDPIAAKLNRIPKHVASTTLETLAWNNSHLLGRSVPDAIARLKQQAGGEIQVTGSWKLIQTLLEHDLVDEFRLWTFPIVLGKGKRLFGDGAVPSRLALVETRTSTTGVAIHRYERAGKPEYGSFALEQQAAE